MPARYSYEFDGNQIVEVIRQENVRAESSDVLAKVMETFTASGPNAEGEIIFERTPTLPNNCRLYWRDGFSEHYLVEVRPGRFPFKWAEWYHEDTDTALSGGEVEAVAMPWQYFVFNFIRHEQPNPYNIEANFESLQLFWANERFETMNSRVYAPLLPNIGSNYSVCLGDVYPNSTDPTWRRIEETVDNFYESHFNGDLGWEVPYFWKYAPDDGTDMIYEWERQSQKDILVWQKWDIGTYRSTSPLHYPVGYNPTPPSRNIDSRNLYSLLYDSIRQSRANLW